MRRERRKLGFFLKCFIIFLLLFKVFPSMGLYAFLFDRGTYREINLPEDQAVADLDQLTPKTRRVALEFLAACQRQGLNVKITETYRSQKRQEALYAQGRTKPGSIVTWTKKSRHSQRYAFDICKNGPRPYEDDNFFKQCADIGKNLGLTPGYYWTSNPDPGHFQYDCWWNHSSFIPF